MDRLVDEVEAASILGMKPQTLSVWRSTGRYALRFVKVGRLVRYRVSDLLAFVESRVVTSTGQAANL
jgi:hypothetical protein